MPTRNVPVGASSLHKDGSLISEFTLAATVLSRATRVKESNARTGIPIDLLPIARSVPVRQSSVLMYQYSETSVSHRKMVA
jgi:hypothetical protein